MRSWRRIVREVGSDRQLDQYMALLMSLVVGGLGLFDVVSESVLVGATLATLSVVALGTLGGRAQLTTLMSATADLARAIRQHLPENSSADRLLRPSTSGLDVDLREASDVGIVGVTLNRTLRNQFAALAGCLDRGATVRIAVIEPGLDTLQEAARRSTIPGLPDTFANRLRPTLDLLLQLAIRPSAIGRLEVRLLGFVPAFGLILIDPQRAHGRVQVDVYSHRLGAEEPTMPLGAVRDPRWYRHFLDEFERIWTAGRPLGERPHASRWRAEDIR